MRSSSVGAVVLLLAAAAARAEAAAVTVPIALVDNHISTSVSINGHGPYRFIVDTGGTDLIAPELAAQLGLAPNGTAQFNGVGSGVGTMNGTSLAVHAFAVGGVTLTDTTVYTLDMAPISHYSGVAVEGMVGTPFFRAAVVTLDFADGTMTVTDPKDFTPSPDFGTPVPLRLHDGTPNIDGAYDGVAGTFDLDTGAGNMLTLTSPFVAANALRDRARRHLDVQSGVGFGGKTYARMVRDGKLTFGGISVDKPVVELSADTEGSFADASYSGNIGTQLLKRFVVTLDYGRGVAYFRTATKPVGDFGTFDRSGLGLVPVPNGLEIAVVTPASPAERAGLKSGDVITAVDGKAAATLDFPTLRERLRNDAPGTVVNFTLTDGKTLKITLDDQI